MKSPFRALLLSAAALFSVVSASHAQVDLFGNPENKELVHRGILFGANANVDLPAGDMADRYGTSFRIGPSVHYKAKSGFVIGLKFDFITGNKIREANYMSNIKEAGGFLINSDGRREAPGLFERGYAVGLQAGKIFNVSGKPTDNGIMALTTLGFMQHKINIFDKDKTLYQLRGDYRKGYDRLANGIFAEQYLGYAWFDKTGVINIHLGVDALFGFTQGRRDYQFDTMAPGREKRLDMLLGARVGIYLALFRQRSEELYFDAQ